LSLKCSVERSRGTWPNVQQWGEARCSKAAFLPVELSPE